MKSKLTIAAAVISGCACVAILCSHIDTLHDRPPIGVGFLSLAPNPTGTTVASFASHSSRTRSVLLSSPFVETWDTPRPAGLGSGSLVQTLLLRSGRPTIVTVEVPSSSAPWRATWRYHSLSPSERVRLAVASLMARIGINIPMVYGSFSTIHSDWMAPEERLEDWSSQLIAP